MTLVRIVKDWAWPDLMRQTPGNTGIWEGIQFTLDGVEACDYLVFLNNQMKRPITAFCPRENIWAIMQEPFYKGHSDWLVEGLDPFYRVFTHHPPANTKKYITSHPALPWYVDKTYDQLASMPFPTKTQKGSWIVGNADDLPGHTKRTSILKAIQNASPMDIDLFGRAVCPINDKWDGLAPYKYSLAIENSSSPDYWTEKIADCFLAWTVPIYYGCVNIDKYFPKDSFIWIDINDPAACIETIKNILATDEYEKRLPALTEARNLVLNNYQIFPYLSQMINSRREFTGDKLHVSIPPYKKSLKATLYRRVYKLRKKLLSLP